MPIQSSDSAAKVVAGDQSAENNTSIESNLSAPSNLTSTQLQIWLGQKLHPTAPLYNMVHTFTIHGPVQPAAFQQAFQTLINKSDALRTVILEIDGAPRQQVQAHFPYTLDFVDFSAELEPQAVFDAWLDERKVRLFDLSRGLFDSALLKLAENRFVWYLSIHHLSADVLAFALIYRRMSDFYRLALAGRLDQAPDLPAYGDFRQAEREYIESPNFEKANAYWQEKLAEPLEPTNYYGKSLIDSLPPRTRRVACHLGPDRSAHLRRIAQETGIRALTEDMSLFHSFAAVLATTLHKLSGKERLALGVPFHNRPTPQFKETIGLFINIYPLVVDVNAGDTFRSLIRRNMNETFTALRYAQHSSAEANKAYDVVLNYLTASFGDFAGYEAENRWIHPGYGDSHHALRLQVLDLENNGNLALYFDFNTEIFDAQRQQWLVDHFLAVLDSFLADRDQPLSQITLLSKAHQQQLLTDFNRTAAPFPVQETVVQLFERQVAETPQAEAVVCGQQALSYAALNQKANQLAHYLRARGVGPESLVGIYMTRSPEALAAVWGVLKAGAAYVPLDAAYPHQRIGYMLAEISQARPGSRPILLTQARLSANVPAETAEVVCLDSDWPAIARHSPENPTPGAAAGRRLAYVIFTSGSTGRPKGVMIEHTGLTNYVWWAKETYTRGEPLSFPLFSSISFDLTVTSIFVPLVSGGRVVIYGEDDYPRGMEILQILADNAVDVIKLTPSHLVLAKEAHLASSRVKRLIVGGEDFKTNLARTIHEMFNGRVEIYNEYGPTEAVVGCMIHRFDPDLDIDASVPVGTPNANAKIYVLDRQLNPVPPGVVGEMFIAGAGLARGYLNQPALTAERFIDNPFEPGAKLYRTGDLARWNEAGQMEFLGRADDQVKIRGARIELGEVEAALLSHPDITDCVVDVVQYEQPQTQSEKSHCLTCGLPSNYPGANFDEHGLCELCRLYAQYEAKIREYFKSPDDLLQIVAEAKASKSGDYDCMMLYSGGKDSSYALAQLVEMGLNPLVYSFDNGYISDEAKANIRRVVAQLNLDLVMETTPAILPIFTDSLKRHSNVCNGCFKAIYTLSMKAAHKHGIKYIFTGLSRGQLFETRLGHLFRNRVIDVEDMDAAILEARKVYHRMNDAVTQLLDVEIFKDDAIFEEIQFVDFYRYTDVRLDEVYRYLARKLNWTRPADTGRSTNCLINDLGIHIHQKERGYHNYALPYSWDVRLGHKTREETLHELDDDIDLPAVKRMLTEIGYSSAYSHTDRTENRLAAYYTARGEVNISSLRTFLGEALPDYMVPSYFVQLAKIPVTQNGKVDRHALPHPGENRPELGAEFVAPTTLIETELANIWAQTLQVKQVGVRDNFFDLGGASVPAVQVLTQIAQLFQVELPLRALFEAPTVAELSERIEAALISEIESLSDEEAERLLAALE